MSIRRTLLAVLLATPLVAQADLNIIAIGDSHTVGDISAQRSSYRPYLDQSIRNFQTLPNNNAANLNVNWLGTSSESNNAYVPTGSDPIAVDAAAWSGRDNHQAQSGISSLHYTDPPPAVAVAQIDNVKSAITAAPADDTNLALILLGSNDFGMFQSASATHPAQLGWTSSRFDPTQVFDSITGIVNALQDLSVDPDLEVLIAAIPPVDERRRYTESTDPASPGIGNLWNETDRHCTSGSLCNGLHQDLVHWDDVTMSFVLGPGADGLGAPAVTDSNHIIGALNDALQAWASGRTNVGFVDPFRPSGGYALMGPTGDEAVDNGGAFDLVGINGELEDLSDGLHLTAVGDQYYAAAFWEQGVRLTLSETANAESVPEPSSFLFLGCVGLLTVGVRRYFLRHA